MLKKITYSLAGIFVLVIVLGLVMPSNYAVSRSITINSPVKEIHSFINDLEQWPKWAPWQDQEKEVDIDLGDISAGVGATQKWIGHDGKGSLEITHSSPTSGIQYLLRFGNDKEDTKGEFAYQTNGNQTTVSWTMSGEMTMPIIGPYAVLIMDTMAGPMFEKGLEKLKNVVEGKVVEKPVNK